MDVFKAKPACDPERDMVEDVGVKIEMTNKNAHTHTFKPGLEFQWPPRSARNTALMEIDTSLHLPVRGLLFGARNVALCWLMVPVTVK